MLIPYYHATPYENLPSIMCNGIKRSSDGFVYLTTSPEDAVKFLRIRLHKDILVIKVHLPQELVGESYDHSEAFFKCKAYIYDDDIPAKDIVEMNRWQFD